LVVGPAVLLFVLRSRGKYGVVGEEIFGVVDD
jgi:hypothetical protein